MAAETGKRFNRLAVGIAATMLGYMCAAAKPVDVTFLMCYRPDHPEDPSTKQILRFTAAHPEIRPLQWGGLTLPGAGGRATFMLALAGNTAPDVYKAWFHILRHDIDEGFCHPLNEWLGEDADGDGRLSDAEAKWSGWKDVPPLWRDVATKNGKVYAVPTPGFAYYGLIYRKDLVKAAALDPEAPPRTWNDFTAWCERLTYRDKVIPGATVQRGQRALGIENRPWGFLPWVGAAGGDVIRRSGEKWEACFDSPECLRAAEFLKGLIARGVVRTLPELSLSNEVADLFVQGEIACVFGGEDLVAYLTENLNFPADQIGLMPFPAADEKCLPVLQAHKHFYAMTEGVARRPKAERDAVWACVNELASKAVYDETVRKNVAEGRARWCLPADLERLGFNEHLAEVPPGIRQMYADLSAGRIKAVTEPYMGFWQAASDLVSRRFLGILLSDAGKDLDCAAALKSITEDANRGLMFQADKRDIDAKRPLARVILGVLAICALVCIWLIAAKHRNSQSTNPEPRTTSHEPRTTLHPWLFLAPAIISIALWSYWPLIRGAMMAFQDYRIVGSASWEGLDNFIRVATSPGFWKAWARTLEYVGITLVLGFTTPILLALLLSEIPRGKVFFRTVYFLPHLTSALVVTLMWKMMFDPTENGLLNQALAHLGIARHAWLQDPAWAMTCCILPGVWAGAGMASLIYVAALHSLPPDYYEAAAIDGAGIFGRFRHVTLPQLAPLMVINFVGAFIAAFQGMGSIFLLTFGGPGDATNVLSLAIWKEAYNNLRFSTATTMAWFLGVALIGFTYLQIRFLRRVEFRQAAAN
ncbi:MAG: extracellular solute-binding protein [Kiritimatiellae bacterium]|nr:extracellular solute-binding protein [Kiritimatiellia bacterium]